MSGVFGNIPAMDSPPELRFLADPDRAVVERLWQLYSHDMSENRGAGAFWRRVVADLVGTEWHEELLPVADKPGKKNIPRDHMLHFSV